MFFFSTESTKFSDLKNLHFVEQNLFELKLHLYVIGSNKQTNKKKTFVSNY